MKFENNRRNFKKLENSCSVPVRRGEIYYADFGDPVGSEQGGVRPVLIIQNDVGNKYSPTVIVAAITSRVSKAQIPTHIKVKSAETGLPMDSVVLLEQVRTMDKSRLRNKVGEVGISSMGQINDAVAVSFGLRCTCAA